MTYEISDARADEYNFVYASCKQSTRNSTEWSHASSSTAFAYLNSHFNALIDRSAVLVARQGRKILGFVVFEMVGDDFLLHYAYTRHDSRRQGVARELLLAALESCPGAVGTYYTLSSARFGEVANRYNLVLCEAPK